MIDGVSDLHELLCMDFQEAASKKTWFFLLFWSEVQIVKQNKAPYLSYIEYLFEKNMQKQAAQKCSWFVRH